MTNSIFSVLAATSGAAASGPPAWFNLVPFVGMFVVLWFLILRPQMRRQKEQVAKIAGIKKGDQVLTGGGLLGKVIKVDENYAEIELGTNVRVKALKSTISDVIPPTGAKPAND
jgi:preprotein translocase subunit YajC